MLSGATKLVINCRALLKPWAFYFNMPVCTLGY